MKQLNLSGNYFSVVVAVHVRDQYIKESALREKKETESGKGWRQALRVCAFPGHQLAVVPDTWNYGR